jgi:hypothetical protein
MSGFDAHPPISHDTVIQQNRTFELVGRNPRDEQSLGAFLSVGIEWHFRVHGKPNQHKVTAQMRPYWEAVRLNRLANASDDAKRVLRRRCGWRAGEPWPRTAAHEVEGEDDTDFGRLRSEILGIYTRSAEVNTILIAYSIDEDFADLVDAFRAGTSVVAPSEIVHRARAIRGELKFTRRSSRVENRGAIGRRAALTRAMAQVAGVANDLQSKGLITHGQRTSAIVAFAKAIGAPMEP